jgi:hypothetical protein
MFVFTGLFYTTVHSLMMDQQGQKRVGVYVNLNIILIIMKCVQFVT